MSSYLDEVIKLLEKQMEFVKKTNGQLQLMGDSIRAEIEKNKSIRDSLSESNGYKINAFDLPNGKFMFQVEYLGSQNITQEIFDTAQARDVRFNELRKLMLSCETTFKGKDELINEEKENYLQMSLDDFSLLIPDKYRGRGIDIRIINFFKQDVDLLNEEGKHYCLCDIKNPIVNDLINISEKQLKKIPNLGYVSITAIKETLFHLGLSLKNY